MVCPAIGRAYSKETAMLTSACGMKREPSDLLPPAPVYVDSFGPFYHELRSLTRPATTDQIQHRIRDKAETMTGLSPVTTANTLAVPR